MKAFGGQWLGLLCGALLLSSCGQDSHASGSLAKPSYGDSPKIESLSAPSSAADGPEDLTTTEEPDLATAAQSDVDEDRDAATAEEASVDDGDGEEASYTDAQSCEAGYYQASGGDCVHRPVEADAAPAGSTAHCSDGTYSYSEHRQGTCSYHGGVDEWL